MIEFRKAQASIEFIVSILFLILILIAMSFYMAGKNLEGSGIKAKLEAEKICFSISRIIDTASYSHGYYSEFSLPKTIGGFEYNLTIYNKSVEVDYLEHSCSSTIRVKNIFYGGSLAPFSLCGGTYSINNTDGILYITNLTLGC